MRSMLAMMVTFVLVAASITRGDELRNVKVGQPVPPFTVRTLGGDELSSETLRGKVVVIVYVSAEQRSSEKALQTADAIGRELRNADLAVIGLTGDVTEVAQFREQRDRLNVHRPLGLDIGRKVYGSLGIIALPTTLVIDREGRLAHVIASYKSDHEHVLRSYVRHALGSIGDDELEKLLTMHSFHRDLPADRIARRRAAARLLQEGGLAAEAEKELRAALEIDPDDGDTLLDLAALFLDQGRVDDADAYVTKVMEDAPDHRRGGLLRGAVLYHQGRLDEAQRVLERALLLNPDPVRTHYYLGLIAERRGDTAAAARHFKNALARLLADRPM